MNSIHGIPGLPRLPVPGAPARPPAGEGAGGPGAPLRGPERPALPDPVEGGLGAVPVDPPPGTDPDLWTILTTEERRFFARARALGPLTYGPRSAPPPPAGGMPGGRIDMRV